MEDLSNRVRRAVDFLFKVDKQSPKTRKILDADKTVYLQVALFKIPFAPSRKRKFLKLRHSLYGSDPEICLFVPNRKTGVEYKKTTEELIDFCVDYYTDILEKHKVKGITTVMPLKQFRSEYGTFELKRKLVRRFDLFLCKNSLLYNSRFLSSLGKVFKASNKEPLGVAFPKEDVDFDPEFQKSIQRAILTSSFYISPFSDNYSIPFGCLSSSKEELEDNLQAVLHQLVEDEIIPGGFENIRAMYLWPSQSKPVPLYISSKLPTSRKKPKLKLKRKRVRGVEDEVSTQPQKKVFVMPGGEVFVTKMEKVLSEPDVQDSEGDESFKDESDEEEVKEETAKSKGRGIGNREESESEDDEEIEEQETRLLEEKKRSDSDPYAIVNSLQKQTETNKTESEDDDDDDDDEEEFDNEEMKSSKKSKLGKRKGKKGKINKPKRKMLMKRKKLNSKEKKNEKSKTKKKTE